MPSLLARMRRIFHLAAAPGWAGPTIVALGLAAAVLEGAGLISRGKEAQWRPCKLEAKPMREVAEFIEFYRRFWDESLDRLEDYLADLQKGDPDAPKN